MKTPSIKEAAVLAKANAIAEAENFRETWWGLMDLRERGRALSLAGLDKSRAADPLATFNDDERNRMRVAIESHVHKMELILHSLKPREARRNWTLH